MKNKHIIRILTIAIIYGLISITGCNEPITEFGFDGHLSGRVIDDDGNIVSGDNKLATFAVDALGEMDQTSMVLRIKPDGTFANSKLYPQRYEVHLIGPFLESPTPIETIDLTGGKKVVKDFHVTPFLTISKPVLNGTPSATEIKIDYDIRENGGKTAQLREIYVSTVSWPTRTTGTGIGYWSSLTVVSTNQGTATITGLQPNTKYFVRIGAMASGQTLFNHSEQISVQTSGN